MDQYGEHHDVPANNEKLLHTGRDGITQQLAERPAVADPRFIKRLKAVRDPAFSGVFFHGSVPSGTEPVKDGHEQGRGIMDNGERESGGRAAEETDADDADHKYGTGHMGNGQQPFAFFPCKQPVLAKCAYPCGSGGHACREAEGDYPPPAPGSRRSARSKGSINAPRPCRTPMPRSSSVMIRNGSSAGNTSFHQRLKLEGRLERLGRGTR